MTNLRRTITLAVLAVLSSFCFFLNTDLGFQPTEVSLDLTHQESKPHLSGDWNLIDSKSFRGIMDSQVVGENAHISFNLPAEGVFWFRIKAFFLNKEQAFQFRINHEQQQDVKASYSKRAQKIAFRVPAGQFHSGPNKITLGVSQALPVVIEKIELRNYRARLEGLPVFVGFDHVHPEEFWDKSTQKLLWLPLVWLILFLIQVIHKRFWQPRLISAYQAWQSPLEQSTYLIPHLVFFGILVASWVTPYRILMKPAAYFVFWGLGILIAQVGIGGVIGLIALWRFFWDQPQVIQEAMRLGEMPLRLSAKLWLILLLVIKWLPNLPLVVSRIVGFLMDRPGLLFAGCIASFFCSTLVAFLQGLYYTFAVRTAGEIVNLHGAYPWSRALTESISDTVGLFCLVALLISRTLYLRRQVHS